MKQKTGLGKGLGALLSSRDICKADDPGFFLCPVEKIRPNPDQPRKTMSRDALETLAESIREKGVLQPLVVREVDDCYEIVAGERRWRAARQAGVNTVPVVIKDISPDEVLELALIENIQREDLNPIEEAMAYQRLIEEMGLTQAEAAAKVGRDRSTVANFLRLLQLPGFARQDLLDERYSMGHAKTILMVESDKGRRLLRDRIVKKGLSVRQAEALARKIEKNGGTLPEKKTPVEDPDTRRLNHDLTELVGSRVKVITGRDKKGGRLEIKFESHDELEHIISVLRKGRAAC
jgi:ParB family chromosome partitioning protein